MDIKNIKLSVIALCLQILFSFVANAQISQGGNPGLSFKDINISQTNCKTHHFTPSASQLKRINLPSKGQAFQFAHQFTVNYTPDNSGQWTFLEDGTRVWQLLITSPEAYSINLIFDRYVLPEGAKLFIYNIDKSDVIGAFTHKNNKPSGILATVPVEGDSIIVEYQEPKNAEFKGELMVGAVNHDFIGIHKKNSLKTGYFGDSGACNTDVSCYDVDDSLGIRRSVVKLIINGSELCTGTLINNQLNDGTPYIVTAAHCLRQDNTATKVIAYFNYEVPHCIESIEGSKDFTISEGATKVLVDSLDIALFELSDLPPENYKPYYAGWNRNTSLSKPFKSIHHPQGDVKKIATFEGDLQEVSFIEPANMPYAQVEKFHWRVSRWTSGTTEVGSSGCPLFDGQNLFIGTLSGGAAYCGNPVNDYFAQFCDGWDHNLNWNLEASDQEYFAPWLDPAGTDVQSIDGYDPYEEQEITRLSNIESNDTPLKTTISEGGYLSGHNGNFSLAYAEKFSGIKSATINGVYVMPSQYVYNSTQTINIAVWNGSDYPEDLIALKEGVNISGLKSNMEHFIPLTTPVAVTGNFFIGFEINYNSEPVDYMAMYYSSAESKENNNMLVYNESSGWHYASELYNDNLNFTLWVDALAENVVYGDTVIETSKGKDVTLFPNPVDEAYFYINSNNNFLARYEILDLYGRVIDNGGLNSNSSRIPIYAGDLNSGLYVLKLYSEDKQIVKKILVK